MFQLFVVLPLWSFPRSARLLILYKIAKPRVRSRCLIYETWLIESNGESARSEDQRRNVHMVQQWVHTRALFRKGVEWRETAGVR